MWTEPGKVTYQGKHYSIVDAICEPKPDPLPPIIVGGGGTKTMMLAACYADWWNIPDANFADYSDRVAVLHDHCRTIRRDPGQYAAHLVWPAGVGSYDGRSSGTRRRPVDAEQRLRGYAGWRLWTSFNSSLIWAPITSWWKCRMSICPRCVACCWTKCCPTSASTGRRMVQIEQIQVVDRHVHGRCPLSN